MAERKPRGWRPRQAGPRQLVETLADVGGDPGDALLIGLGNSLRGDDGVGIQLATWAQRCWPELRVHGVQQLTPELSCELATARRVLFVDAWWLALATAPRTAEGDQTIAAQPAAPAQASGDSPVAASAAADGARQAAAGHAPRLIQLRLGREAGSPTPETGAFSHRLEPAQLLAITALLHHRAPKAWQLLVPAFRFAHGEGLSAELQAQLPAAEALLRQWCGCHA